MNIFDLLGGIMTYIGKLQGLFWAVAVMLFLWGLVKFMKNTADTEAHEEGKHLMVWGIIAFFVLVSLWGLVTFILNTVMPGFPGGAINFVDKNGATM